MLSGKTIDKSEICRLIPHTGLMCLLDKVTQYDDKHIVCYSNTHQDMGNPLRNDEILPVYALLEYGAQAMAVHCALLEEANGETIHEGYLAALRDVVMNGNDISRIRSTLCIVATQLMSSQGNMIYNFSVKSDEQILITGRATVVAIFQD